MTAKKAPPPKPKSPAKSSAARKKRARARTPAQLARQERVFELSVVDGRTVREIAAEVGITQDTVIADLRHESQRRSDELADRREIEKARAVAFYDTIARKGIALAARSTEAFMQPLARGLGDALKARERIDKILGLDAPTKVDVGLADLLDALDVPE